MTWLDKWSGQYPYASSLYGVYQPLIGWRSRLKLKRLDGERLHHIRRVVHSMIGDSRYTRQLGTTPRPVRPDEQLPPRLYGFLGEVTSQGIFTEQQRFLDKNGRPPAGANEWTQVVNAANLPGLVTDVTTRAAAAERALVGLDPGAALDHPTDATLTSPYLVHEAMVAGVFNYLAQHAPGALEASMRARAPLALENSAWVDPLAAFDPKTQQAFLSPIGPMQLYRQYFFELDTLLGPPVGHVWISPGSSLELYEVHTLRSIQVREQSQETMSDTKTESTLNTSDELASAVSNENNQNMSTGVSVNAGVNMAVWHASTAATFNTQDSKKSTDQETHKMTRAATTKAASEVRENFKTSFKTTLDQTDTVSRRYVLQNQTEHVVNYELRRKMRRIAVQLQHIGTRLCWQVIVDNPGEHLGIAELVHVAKPWDNSGSQPPTAPTTLLPQETTMTVPIPFVDLSGGSDGDDDYSIGTDHAAHSGENRIQGKFTFSAIPPAAGYLLQRAGSGITLEKLTGTNNAGSSNIYLVPGYAVHKNGIDFDIILDKVNFDDNLEMNANLRLVWQPPDQSQQIAAYHTALVQYDEKQRREEHAAYVQSVRDRLDATAQVKKRPSDDLREEERISIYRGLLRQLVRGLGEPSELHASSELIRSVFDLDSMLYFVAPDYWKPHHAAKQQLDHRSHVPSKAKPKLNLKHTPPQAHKGSQSIHHALETGEAHAQGHAVTLQIPDDNAQANGLNPHDLIAWGGEMDRRRDNYLVTENTTPAPMGASLGWMMQLDGDDRRNAFLNAPWVKAVIPIRPGHEEAAIAWLQRDHVEGADGFGDAPFDKSQGATIGEALAKLAHDLATQNIDPATIGQADQVFEQGFSPLTGGIQLGKPAYQPFDQWIEIMPTDQVVAVDYVLPPIGPPIVEVPNPKSS